MRKAVYTVKVDNYLPDLCKITLPTIERYAKRIGADFFLIEERLNPDFPPTYEKTQIYELGRGKSWNILIDADIVIRETMPDLTEVIPQDYVAAYMSYQANLLFSADEYFVRDGRRIGICSNFMLASHMCHDIWTPLEMPFDVAKNKSKREHILDEYCFSRNLARYGLKITGFEESFNPSDFIHLDASSNNEVDMIKKAELFLNRYTL